MAPKLPVNSDASTPALHGKGQFRSPRRGIIGGEDDGAIGAVYTSVYTDFIGFQVISAVFGGLQMAREMGPDPHEWRVR